MCASSVEDVLPVLMALDGGEAANVNIDGLNKAAGKGARSESEKP
jgi:hypothetical protein